MRLESQRDRSPHDLYFFGTLEYGRRDLGVQLEEDELDPDQLAEFGVDWEALDDPHDLNHHAVHNPPEHVDLPAGNDQPFSLTHRPAQLAQVVVPVFQNPFNEDQSARFFDFLHQVPELGSRNMDDRRLLWIQALDIATSIV